MNQLQLARLLYTIFYQNPLDTYWIEDQGLLAVKIGQTFALRVDFLDAERCHALTRLYRATTSIPPEDAERLLHASVSPEWFDQFAHIDYMPLASASVGHVITGILQNGRKVVIKIVKHQFKKNFLSDIRSAKRLMRTAIRLYPKLERVADPVGIIGYIEEYTLNELNLLHEIAGQDTLKNIYEQNKSRVDLSHLHFPYIYRELSNARVMVSEYVEGKTIDEKLHDGSFTYAQMLELFHIHGFYLFGVGTFHGDIHPGNIIIDDATYTFIDTGAISHVHDRIRLGLFYFFEKLSQFEYEGAAHYLNQMAEQRIEGKRFVEFQKKFCALYADFTHSTVSQVSLTQKMMHTIKLGVHSGMIFEKGMYGIIKSMMYLDGMVLRCNPEAVLMRDIRPFIQEFLPYIKRHNNIPLN